MSSDSDKRREAQRRVDEYSRSLRDQDDDKPKTSWPGSGSSSGNQSTQKFKKYVPTDQRAQAKKWGFYNGGNGGGGGGGRPDNGGGGGGGFVAPHLQNTTSSSNKGRSNSHCDSGYSSTSSGGRRNSSFNLSSPHCQQDGGFRPSFGSGGFGSLENYGGGGDRNRHPASSGSDGHRRLGRSLSESSTSSMGSSAGFGGLNLSAIYEQEFGKKKKK